MSKSRRLHLFLLTYLADAAQRQRDDLLKDPQMAAALNVPTL
jgi:hypothetical protein